MGPSSGGAELCPAIQGEKTVIKIDVQHYSKGMRQLDVASLYVYLCATGCVGWMSRVFHLVRVAILDGGPECQV
jgi:hypothetical protein